MKGEKINTFMLSCKIASQLIEKRLHFGLNFIENIKLYVHTRMCGVCSDYKKKNSNIDKFIKDYLKSETGLPTDDNPVSLSENVKERIAKSLGNK